MMKKNEIQENRLIEKIYQHIRKNNPNLHWFQLKVISPDVYIGDKQLKTIQLSDDFSSYIKEIYELTGDTEIFLNLILEFFELIVEKLNTFDNYNIASSHTNKKISSIRDFNESIIANCESLCFLSKLLIEKMDFCSNLINNYVPVEEEVENSYKETIKSMSLPESSILIEK